MLDIRPVLLEYRSLMFGTKRVGRNEPCPCGSGAKFKFCHGKLDSPTPTLQKLAAVPEFVKTLMKEHAVAKVQAQRQQGLGRGIIAAEFKGSRLVAVGNTLHSSPNWKTFHDFLLDYVKIAFGKDWWMDQVGRKEEERHTVLTWAEMHTRQQAAHIAAANEVPRGMPATGAMLANLSLGYDLYCVAHNESIQKALIKRLKVEDLFWGARFELAAAAHLIRAGFRIEFEDENDRGSTHCEFTATHKSGRRFSVEAKHRNTEKLRFGRLLYRALTKKANFERIVFLDVNMPDSPTASLDSTHPLLRAVEHIRFTTEGKLFNGTPLPPAYLVLTNAGRYHALETASFRDAALIEGFQIPGCKHDATFVSVRAAVEEREKHREVFQLAESMLEHYEVPSTFDGEIPQFAYGRAEARLKIGDTYELEIDGRTTKGVMTTGVVVENEKIAICGMTLEGEGKSVLYTFPLSDDEIEVWRRYPDTFFGEVGQKRTQLRDPIDLFDFFHESNLRTTHENLRKQATSAPDFERLNGLSREALARELAIRHAESAHALTSKAKPTEMRFPRRKESPTAN